MKRVDDLTQWVPWHRHAEACTQGWRTCWRQKSDHGVLMYRPTSRYRRFRDWLVRWLS